MEFLEAFKQAQTLGLTKEEFIGIWKAEVEQKLHTASSTLHKTSQGDVHQKAGASYNGSGQAQTQSPVDRQQHEKLNSNPSWNFQHPHKQLAEKEEQHGQQLQLKHDKTIEELRSRFENLSKHVGNIADLNTRSVKLHFMQELELLKQELGRVIKDKKVNKSSSHLQSERSTQNALQKLQLTNVKKKAQLTNARQTQLTNAQQTQFSNAQQTQLSNVQQTQLSNAQQTQLTNAQQTQLTNAQQTQLSNAQQTQLTNAQQTQLINAQQTQLPNAQQTQLSNAQQTQLSNAQQTQLTNVQQKTVCSKVPANDKSNNNKSVPVKNNIKDTQDNKPSKSYLPLFPTLQQQNHNPVESNFKIQTVDKQDGLMEEWELTFEHTPSVIKTSESDTVTPYINWGKTRDEIHVDAGKRKPRTRKRKSKTGSTSVSTASSGITLNEGSVKDDGLHAEIITKQMELPASYITTCSIIETSGSGIQSNCLGQYKSSLDSDVQKDILVQTSDSALDSQEINYHTLDSLLKEDSTDYKKEQTYAENMLSLDEAAVCKNKKRAKRRLQYKRGVLIQLRDYALTLGKPDGLPPEDIILDNPIANLPSRVNCDPTPPLSQPSENINPAPQISKKKNHKSGLPQDSVKPLHKSENPWKPMKKRLLAGELEEQTRTLESEVLYIMNRITPTNFEHLVEDMMNLNIKTYEDLQELVMIIFDKITNDTTFVEVYAKLCKVMSSLKVPPPPNSSIKHIQATFRVVMLTKCQQQFETDKTTISVDFEEVRKKMESELPDGPEKRLQISKTMSEMRMKRLKYFGNIKFIGELFKLGMFTENIMHDCIYRLLKAKDDVSLLSLCDLLAIIGQTLDTEKAKCRMDQYFSQMAELSDERTPKIKFALKNIIDLRSNNWVPRKENTGPKNEVHKDFQQEQTQEQALEQAKEQVLGQAKEQDKEQTQKQVLEQAQKQARELALEQAQKQALEQAQKQAKEHTQKQAWEHNRQKQAQEEAQKQAWEHTRQKQAQKQAQEDAQKQSLEKAQKQAWEHTRQKQAQEDAQKQALEEAQKQAWEHILQKQAQEYAQKQALEEAQKQAWEHNRQKEAQKQAWEHNLQKEAQKQAQEGAQKQALEQAWEYNRQKQAQKQAREDAQKQSLEQAQKQAWEHNRQKEAQKQAQEDAQKQQSSCLLS